MITLIHGEDISASRNYYFELKQKSLENTVLDGITITPTDLEQQLGGSDLFGERKDIFIENLLSKRKSTKEIESLVSIINNQSAVTSTLWESKELTPKQIALLNKPTVKLFKIPSTIFALLDSLKPGNVKQLVEQFHKTLVDKDPEFVLVMLQRQVRILLALSSSSVVQRTIDLWSKRSESRSTNQIVIARSETTKQSQSTMSNTPYAISNMQITELSRLAPWQKGKLEKQAQLFSTNILVLLHEKLFQLELGMKTGGLSLPLDKEIDLLLLSV